MNTNFQLIVPLSQADILRTVTLPHLQLFGISEGLELRVRNIFMRSRNMLIQVVIPRSRGVALLQEAVAKFNSYAQSLSKLKRSILWSQEKLNGYVGLRASMGPTHTPSANGPAAMLFE